MAAATAAWSIAEPVELLHHGFGVIIGTVWVLLVGDWMIVGGGPVEAMIAFVLARRPCLIGSTSGAVTMVGSLPGVLVMTPLFYTGFDTIRRVPKRQAKALTGRSSVWSSQLRCWPPA